MDKYLSYERPIKGVMPVFMDVGFLQEGFAGSRFAQGGNDPWSDCPGIIRQGKEALTWLVRFRVYHPKGQ